MAKARLDFTGIDTLMRKIETLGGNVDQAAEEALTAAQKLITTDLAIEMRRHKVNGKPVNWDFAEGETKKKLIREPEVEWDGNIASTEVGFEGPSAARFLVRGTPRMTPSKGMYRVLFGAWSKKRALACQEHALADFVANVMGGD